MSTSTYAEKYAALERDCTSEDLHAALDKYDPTAGVPYECTNCGAQHHSYYLAQATRIHTDHVSHVHHMRHPRPQHIPDGTAYAVGWLLIGLIGVLTTLAFFAVAIFGTASHGHNVITDRTIVSDTLAILGLVFGTGSTIAIVRGNRGLTKVLDLEEAEKARTTNPAGTP